MLYDIQLFSEIVPQRGKIRGDITIKYLNVFNSYLDLWQQGFSLRQWSFYHLSILYLKNCESSYLRLLTSCRSNCHVNNMHVDLRIDLVVSHSRSINSHIYNFLNKSLNVFRMKIAEDCWDIIGRGYIHTYIHTYNQFDFAWIDLSHQTFDVIWREFYLFKDIVWYETTGICTSI